MRLVWCVHLNLLCLCTHLVRFFSPLESVCLLWFIGKIPNLVEAIMKADESALACPDRICEAVQDIRAFSIVLWELIPEILSFNFAFRAHAVLWTVHCHCVFAVCVQRTPGAADRCQSNCGFDAQLPVSNITNHDYIASDTALTDAAVLLNLELPSLDVLHIFKIEPSLWLLLHIELCTVVPQVLLGKVPPFSKT